MSMTTTEADDSYSAIILSEIEGNIVKLTVEGNCRICKDSFTEYDAKVGIIDNMCVACFTSNA